MPNTKPSTPKPSSADPMVLLNCRIPESLKSRFAALAKRQDRVFQRVVATALREYLSRQERV